MATKYGVGGYPTLKFFKSGRPIAFKGERTSDSIISWMKKKSGPPAKNICCPDTAKKFIEASSFIGVIGFFSDPNGPNAKKFLQVAEEMDDHGFTYGITSEPDVFASYDLKEDAIVLFKPFDEGRSDFKEKSFKVEDIKSFLM